MRSKNINVEVNLTDKKIPDQVKIASKKTASFIICIGENEVKTEKYKIKNMETGEEKETQLNEIHDFIK